MHIKYLFLPLLLTYFGQTYPVTCQATVLKHEQKNKTVLLLGDIHAWAIAGLKEVGCNQSTIDAFEAAGQAQYPIFSDFIKSLLHVAHKKTCIVTETNLDTVAPIADQEAGFAQKSEDNEIIALISRLLLKHLMKDGTTSHEKNQALGAGFKAQKGKYLDRTLSALINDNVVWVLGDTERTLQDNALCFGVYKYRTGIIEALKQQDTSLPDELKDLTIGFVKEYITSLQTLFSSNEFKDMYGQSIMDTLNDILSRGGLSDTDHFALLYQYLVDNNAADQMDSLNNKLISFISQKHDLELLLYADAITESDDECDQAVIVGGVWHTQLLRDHLLTKGYTIAHQLGIEHIDDNNNTQPSYYEQIVEQVVLLNNNFDTVVQSVLA